MQLLALLLNFEHKKRKVDVGRWVLGGRFTSDIQRLACDSMLQHPHAPCHNLGCFVYIYFGFVFVLFLKFPIIGRCPCPLGKMSQNLDIRFFIFLTFHCYLAVLK